MGYFRAWALRKRGARCCFHRPRRWGHLSSQETPNHDRRTPPPSTPRSRPEYQRSFITRVHQVLSMGYERLDPRAPAGHEEEDITGELTRAMQTALQDPGSPRWAKNFWTQEEIPVHGQGRLGKRRP